MVPDDKWYHHLYALHECWLDQSNSYVISGPLCSLLPQGNSAIVDLLLRYHANATCPDGKMEPKMLHKDFLWTRNIELLLYRTAVVDLALDWTRCSRLHQGPLGHMLCANKTGLGAINIMMQMMKTGYNTVNNLIGSSGKQSQLGC